MKTYKSIDAISSTVIMSSSSYIPLIAALLLYVRGRITESYYTASGDPCQGFILYLDCLPLLHHVYYSY